jgi:2-polyprenyl-3-methyl-5-hydroxy-6-metoxy-1,4-benzoquinol methylase
MIQDCPACGLASGAAAGRPVHGYSRLIRCPGCRSEFLSPQPDDARLAEIYGPEYYEPWHWEHADVVRAMKARTFLRALGHLDLSARSRLLDVGCAQGELPEVATSLGMQVTGLDLNARAIEVARERVPNATFVCGQLDPETVGLGWDVVTMFDFIEHVRAPVDTLSAAAAVMAPSGRLLISTPRVGSGFHRVTGRAWPQYREEHLTLFSLDGMRVALARAGMNVISAVPTIKYVSAAYLLGQAASYGPEPVRVLAGRSRGLLVAKPAHRLVPFRFGEMTVVASRLRG